MKIFNGAKFRDIFTKENLNLDEPTERIDSGKNGQMLRMITDLDHHDEFYTIVDLRSYKIVWEFNLEKHLGHCLQDNQGIYINTLVHPFLREWHLIFAAGMFHGVLKNVLNGIEYLSSRYVINIPIKKKDGKYMLVKQISMPFQFDVQGNVVSYMNCFSIIEEYKGQPLNPRILLGNQRDTLDNNILRKLSAEFLLLYPKCNLTASLFKIVKEILNIKIYEKGRFNEIIHLRLKKSTVGEKVISIKSITDYNLRIKKRLLPLFNLDEIYKAKYSSDEEKNNALSCLPNLNDVYELVHFAYESGILDILVYEYNRYNASDITL